MSACGDGGGNGDAPTPTPTSIPSATPTQTAGPTPTPIVALASFANGSDLSLCVQTQFDGVIENVIVESTDGVCSQAVAAIDLASSSARPHYDLLTVSPIECGPVTYDWFVDYVEGNIASEFSVEMVAVQDSAASCVAP